MRITKTEDAGHDYRGFPTTCCPHCGSIVFNIQATFNPEDFELAYYWFDAECAQCGSLVTAPCPKDLEIE